MRSQRACQAALFTFVLIGTPAAVAAEVPVAQATVSSAGVDFAFDGPVEGSVSLTLTGPNGFLFESTFEDGEAPHVPLFAGSGQPPAAGRYDWSLTVNRPAIGDRQLNAPARAGRADRAARQSGGFTLSEDGSVADPNLPEGGFEKDILHLDDVIVIGSQCVGTSCVNGESFGTDTIRLKETTLRIKFQDTSVSPFPTRDWQLTANDSFSGGVEKFSIDDVDGGTTPFTLEAGARSHSLYVDDSGRIGMGTSTPVTEMHAVSGDTPTLRLQQDGSSSFQPQSWDVAGNEGSFFIRDVDEGTLPFRIRPGADDSAIDVAGDNDVGIGTASPGARLHIDSKSTNTTEVLINNSGGTNGSASGALTIDVGANNANVIDLLSSDGEALLRLFETAGTGAVMSMFDSMEGERFRLATTGGENWISGNLGLNCSTPNGQDFTIHSGTNASGVSCNSGTRSWINAGDVAVSGTSSRTIKENLRPVGDDDVLEKIAAIDVYTYDFISGQKDRIGLMAEDFHQVFGRGSDKILHGQEVQMALWLAVQQLTARNEQLAEELAEIKSRLSLNH